MPPRIPLRALESATRGAGPSFVRLRPAVHIPRRLNSTEASSSRATTKVEVKPDPELTSTPNIVIPPLSRPLGIDVPPKSGPKTYEKKSEKLFDTERTKAERKVLYVQRSWTTHGIHLKLNLGWKKRVGATSTTTIGRVGREGSSGSRRRCSSGKMCVIFQEFSRAQPVPRASASQGDCQLTLQKALYFPNIAGKSLAGNKACTTDLLQDRVSLVSISSTRLSEVSSAAHLLGFAVPDGPGAHRELCAGDAGRPGRSGKPVVPACAGMSTHQHRPVPGSMLRGR